MAYCNVILPLALPGTFTYAIPENLQGQIVIGMRVEVEFGKRKRYAALVKEIHQNKPLDFEAKSVVDIIDKEAIVYPSQLRFWEWLATYYMCSLGEVMAAALPSGLKLTSEFYITIHPDYTAEIEESLSEVGKGLLKALHYQPKINIEDARVIIGKKHIFSLLNELVAAEAIIITETLHRKSAGNLKPHIRLAEAYRTNEDTQQELLDSLSRATKQQAVILALMQDLDNLDEWKAKKFIQDQAGVTSAPVKALLDKGLLEQQTMAISEEVEWELSNTISQLQLSSIQLRALQEIRESEEKVSLLHGVTGSGKTHIYVELIKDILAQGKQVLYLLPEIGLTSQMIHRLTAIFGEQIGVYHSRFNERERMQTWKNVLSGKCSFVLGTRSAIFLPYKELGLIIVDEEHDMSYKQFDPAPRYNARDAGIYLAQLHQAQVVLGSATPSLESYFNTEHKRYNLIELTERHGHLLLPEIEIVNLFKQHIPSNKYQRFSKRLIDELQLVLSNSKQAILFQNRRGYSSYLQCANCQYIVECPNCDVTLTYHKFKQELICHYCAFSEKPITKCAACGAKEMAYIGLGTQRIEDELKELLPKVRTIRMDYDTTRSKTGHQQIIDRFQRHEVDVLVGTQMVTKGLDFDNVSLVGIMDADGLINYPDLRSTERAFQLMEQVSGRAGRKEKRGKVIVQVRNDHYPVLQHVLDHDYKKFYTDEMVERKTFGYPPYFKMLKLTLKHMDRRTCDQAALRLAKTLRSKLPFGIKGPAEPLVARINNRYIREILVFIPRNTAALKLVRISVQEAINQLKTIKALNKLRINIDMDAV